MYEKVLFSLREHAKNINDFERKMKPSTNEELKSHEDATVCCICGKYFLKNLPEDINHRKVRDNCYYKGKYRGAAHSICNLKFNVPNEILVVFHKGSKYDY